MTLVPVTIREPSRDELLKVRIMRRRVMLGENTPPPELGLSATDLSEAVVHMAAFDNDGNVVSSVRIKPIPEDPDVYEVSRMATNAQHRRMGIGARVLAAAEERAIARGAKAFVLDSRVDAQSFYSKAGYWKTGRQKMIGEDTNYIMVKQIKNA